MKKGLKRLLSSLLTTAMLASSMAVVNMGPVTVSAADSAVTITECQGWQETAWAKWNMVTNADSYKVFYKKTSDADSAYTEIDGMLIRKYAGGVWRADILGMPAGSYDIKVSAYKSGSELSSATKTVSVSAQDRGGFAFKGTTTPGAYKADGSLKDGAQVIYFTNDDIATKQVTVKGKNGADVTVSGLSSLLQQLAYAYNPPTAIRLVGRINNTSGLTMSSEKCIEIKGLESGYNKSDTTCEITIEGVGEDAALAAGTCFNKASYCEMRNLAVGMFGDDGVAMKAATYMWIHNLELMYGQPGSDKDQAKGDGSIDLKDDSQYVTISYVHFWDSGKCSLCGMKSESGPNYITYHHNWFDHSDSRHPRIREMSVHIYNNYFDSNAKYGVGITSGGSAFVENNVFENCKHPMLISEQGSDIMENDKSGNADFTGSGTFSGENGGIIKAYNNQISGSDADKFNGGVEPAYYDASATGTNGKATQFDAYLASSRDENVPSSVKAVKGGSTYDNTTLAVSNVNATPEPVETVKATVQKYAGRVNGGDFTYAWPAGAATSYDVDTALKSKIQDYVATTPYVSAGPNEDGSYVEPPATTETTTETTTEAKTETTTKAQGGEVTEATTTAPVPGGSKTHNFSTDGKTSTFYTIAGDNLAAKGDITYNGLTLSQSLKLNSNGSVTFTTTAPGKVTLVFGNSAGKKVLVDDTEYSIANATEVITQDLAAGTHTIKRSSGESFLYYISYADDGSVDPTPTELKGDANGDGSVTMADAKMVLDYASGAISAVTKADLADVSESNGVTAYDAYLIGKIVLGL